MNNDFVVVDELILEIADYKNDYSDMAVENFCGSARPVGKRINICTACTMFGCPTVTSAVPKNDQENTSANTPVSRIQLWL